MDATRLGTGARIAGGSAVVLLIVMIFFGWFSLDGVTANAGPGASISLSGAELEAAAESSGEDTSASAFESFSLIDIVLLLTCVAAVGLVLMRARGASADTAMVATVVAGLGGLSVLLILFRIISPPDFLGALGEGIPDNVDVDTDVGLGIGVFLGLIAAAGITFGAIKAMGEDSPAAVVAAPPPPAPAA